MSETAPSTRKRHRRAEDVERDVRFTNLVELAPDAILVHDGVRILTANVSALRLAGAQRREELIGQPVSVVLDPPYLRGAQERLLDDEHATIERYTDPTRDTYRRLDGSSVEVEVRAVAFLDHGLPAAHLVVRDISDRLALEETSRQVELRVQHAERVEAVGALAGGVAHEINNMLAVILGHADFWLQNEKSDVAAHDDIRAIIKAADRAATITRQLLAFSRHAAHRPVVLNLGEAVRDAEPALRHLLGPSRTLTVRVEDTGNVLVDPAQLQHVLLQLATNARAATVDGAQLVIASRSTEITAPLPAAAGSVIPAGRFGVIEVRDDGEGIAPAVLPRIFEPFFTTRDVGEGAGLGLSAVQGVLAQNDGFITVESEAGAGTVCTIYLPAVDSAELSAPVFVVPSVTTASLDRRSVLIVDDEPALRAVASRVLTGADLNVAVAVDGVEAVEMIERDGPPDLVLTDLRMPRMGGIELQQILKARWPHVQVLLMSGYSSEYLTLDGTITERDMLLQKPYNAASLLEHVRTALALTPAGGAAAVKQ